jgi:hypothetical protein
MKVLLLHSEDEFSASSLSKDFDLIVDFARAPRSTYGSWSLQSGCPAISLYDFADEVEDLYATKRLLQAGMELMVDHSGIDWWDLISLMIVPGLQNAILLSRLANYLGADCELHASRSFPLALGLQHLVKTKLEVPKSLHPALRKVQHYFEVFSELDIRQLCQVAQDKFDAEHKLRRRVANRSLGSNTPVFLLPSAYLNVSRTAVSTAESLPDQDFLLVCARASGKLRSLPKNVRMTSLDSYFAPADKGEINRLMNGWEVLKRQLISSSKEFELAGVIGAFCRMPSLLRWALALRTAWARVFEMENIAGCLCADDTNPYSRIPLILAKKQAIPSVALHHGALDLYMAVKKQHSDFYLAKSAMEHDYLLRRCRVEPERLVGPTPTVLSEPTTTREMETQPAKNWLVFFTEPYEAGSWRVTEVYRELLPRLVETALECRLELVFKLHPFESFKGHMRILQKHLSREQVLQIKVIAGSPNPELWRNTRAALTVESTTALECAALGIPVFFCAWLRHYHGAYLEQYSRFGFGHVLESTEQLANVAQLLRSHSAAPIVRESSMSVEPQLLRELLTGKYAKIAVEA